MSNNQFKIEFEEQKDVQAYYVDQARFYGVVSGSYTSYGIHCIDTQYFHLISNINIKVKQLYAINRRRERCISVRTGEEYEGNYKTYYDPIELNDRYCEVRVEWEGGHVHDFFYGKKPVFDLETRKTNPEQLRKEIIDNPHLHVKIKENLLLNLENYVKNKF